MCLCRGKRGPYKVNKFHIPYKHLSFVILSLSEIFIVGPELGSLLLVPKLILPSLAKMMPTMSSFYSPWKEYSVRLKWNQCKFMQKADLYEQYTYMNLVNYNSEAYFQAVKRHLI